MITEGGTWISLTSHPEVRVAQGGREGGREARVGEEGGGSRLGHHQREPSSESTTGPLLMRALR